jgi:bacterioferritin
VPPTGVTPPAEAATAVDAVPAGSQLESARHRFTGMHCMKGNTKVIDTLNELLTNELTAVNQYFLHARILQNWGYERLWKKVREESIGEMKHADQLIERILFLDGLPNLQRLGTIKVGEKVREMFELDLDLERRSSVTYNAAIELCRSSGDNVSRELLERVLVDTEEHVDWLEEQLTLIEQVGEPQYLSQQIRGDS